MTTRSTTAQQYDASVIRLVQALAKDKKGVRAREPWTPPACGHRGEGDDLSRTFRADHAIWEAFGLCRFGGNLAAFEQRL